MIDHNETNLGDFKMANRTSGAYTRTIYKDFGIIIRVTNNPEGENGCYQFVKNAHNSRFALGMAFGELKDVEGDKKIEFVKSADQMSYDERGQWDMMTGADKARQQREVNRTPMSDLDLY